jgi:hypothetical protein
MDFNTSGYAKNWELPIYCFVDISRCAISSGKKKEVSSESCYFQSGSLGICRAGLTRRDGSNDSWIESSYPYLVLTHLAGISDDHQVLDWFEMFEGFNGALG